MDEIDVLILSSTFGVGVIVGFILLSFFSISTNEMASFICESHGLDLIDYQVGGNTFSKVECGNKRPELQYENYKVFTK